jgi:type I restriction enzyme R subunit
MRFTEAQLEQAFIDLLGVEDIPHVLGTSMLRNQDEVLIKEDLEVFLQKKYTSENITKEEVDSIVRKLETYPASDLYDSNKAIMKLVSNGFALKRDDRSKKDSWIYLIDFDHPENNDFKIVNQLEIYGTEKRIPDGILYINGIPCVVFEFKSAIRENATMHSAY